jgi:hypothetical protein
MSALLLQTKRPLQLVAQTGRDLNMNMESLPAVLRISRSQILMMRTQCGSDELTLNESQTEPGSDAPLAKQRRIEPVTLPVAEENVQYGNRSDGPVLDERVARYVFFLVVSVGKWFHEWYIFQYVFVYVYSMYICVECTIRVSRFLQFDPHLIRMQSTNSRRLIVS